MKKEELIELGIAEDTAKQVMALHGKTVTTLNSQITDLEAEKTSLEEQSTTNQAELDKLKESAKGNEDLTKQLADLQTKLDQAKTDSETKLAEQKKDFAIKLALKEAAALDEDIVLSQLDRDTIKVDDKGLQGFKEQLDSLKESKPFLFQKEEKEPTPTVFNGGNAKGGNSDNSDDVFSAVANKY